MPPEPEIILTPGEVHAVETATIALRAVLLGLDSRKMTGYSPLFTRMYQELSLVYAAHLRQPDLSFGDR